MSTPGSISELLVGLFWPPHPVTQAAIGILIGFALLVAAFVYVPLLLRLFQIGSLQRTVQACFDEESSNAVQRQEVGNAFGESPLAYQWSDFVRRWQNAIAADPIQNASLPELSRAPVRLMDVLDEHPLIPAGSRRSLLPALPALFLSAGLLGAFAGLVFALPGIGLSLDPPAFEASSRSQQVGALMDHLGMALRIGLWGLLLSLGAALTGRFIEGRSEALAESLDGWVQLAYGAISTGELATRTAHEHRAAISRLQDDLGELLRQVSGRPRPLVRSSSAAPGAGAVATPDAESLEAMVTALGTRLSEHVERTLASELAALRESLGGAVERLGASASASPDELSRAVEHLTRSSESQDAASRNLTQTAHTVSDATEELRSGLDDFADVVTKMRETSEALRLVAGRVDSSQATTAQVSEQVGASLERLEGRLDAQRGELRAQVDALQSALERVAERARSAEPRGGPAAPDPALGEAIRRGVDAQAESSRRLEEGLSSLGAAVEQLALQVRALEEARAETPAAPAAKVAATETAPAPGPSGDESRRAGDEAPAKDPEPESDRAGSPQDEGREDEPAPSTPDEEPEPVRPAASDADTIPAMRAPTPEMIYAARHDDETPRPPAPPAMDRSAGGGGTLSGLLRPTHLAGPGAEPPAAPDDFDPESTIALDRFPDAQPDPTPERDAELPDDGDEPPRRSGFFGRRK